MIIVQNKHGRVIATCGTLKSYFREFHRLGAKMGSYEHVARKLRNAPAASPVKYKAWKLSKHDVIKKKKDG